MTDRIKVGDVYLELPKGFSKTPVIVVAEKAEIPDALEGPSYASCRSDPIQEFIAGTHAAPVNTPKSDAPAKRPDLGAEWKTFCGEKSKYPGYWLPYHDKSSRTCGFNPFAFLFGIHWFFFHRMYVNGLISLCVETAPIAALAIFVFPPDSPHPVTSDMGLAGIFIVSVLSRIAIGFWANIALFKHAIVEIDNIRALNLAPEKHLSVIRSAGEVSVTAVILLNLTLSGISELAKFLIQNS